MYETRMVRVGDLTLVGHNPVWVQSMTNTDTLDVEATVAQIERLTEAGCNIVRSSVYDLACAKALSQIKTRIHIPIVADIHFDYRLAIAAMVQLVWRHPLAGVAARAIAAPGAGG